MKAYCTKNNILVTEETLTKFKHIIFDVPFDPQGDARSKPSYYIAIAVFLQHLICSATVSRNTRKRARFRGNKRWTCSVPFPYSLGIKAAPGVFKADRELPFKRGLEALREQGIIKIIRHNHGQHKCREFCLSKKLLERLFPGDRGAYLSRNDRYTYLTNIYDRRQRPLRLEELMALASVKGCAVHHKVSRRDIPDAPFRERVTQVYQRLEPLHINLDAMRDYCAAHNTERNQVFFNNFISHLCDVGVDIVCAEPLTVAYRQSYKTARLGGRSFEVGTGFQYLPRGMKWASLADGYNYDIKSSQLEILRHELRQRGIQDTHLAVLDAGNISRVLKVSEDEVKNFRFATLFSAGTVSLSFKSVTRARLNKLLGNRQAEKALRRWNRLLLPLKGELHALTEHYLSTGRRNRYGLCVRNAVGQNLNCTYKDIRTKKKWQPQQMRRKLLSHMLQGLESRAVYDYVSSHSGVCALEHDGFVSLSKLSNDDWKHPYLRIVLKHDAQ